MGTLLRKTNFEKKSHNAEKTERGTLWDFSTYILSQNSKKWRGTLGGKLSRKKSLAMPKKIERRPLLSSGIVCYAGTFFGSLPWANRGNLKFFIIFGRTILVTSGVSKKKHRVKSHDYSRLFSLEKRRLKNHSKFFHDSLPLSMTKPMAESITNQILFSNENKIDCNRSETLISIQKHHCLKSDDKVFRELLLLRACCLWPVTIRRSTRKEMSIAGVCDCAICYKRLFATS